MLWKRKSAGLNGLEITINNDSAMLVAMEDVYALSFEIELQGILGPLTPPTARVFHAYSAARGSAADDESKPVHYQWGPPRQIKLNDKFRIKLINSSASPTPPSPEPHALGGSTVPIVRNRSESMIGLKISRNGKPLILAADNAARSLSFSLSWWDLDSKICTKSRGTLSGSLIDSDKEYMPMWIDTDVFSLGDTIDIEVVETSIPDIPETPDMMRSEER